MKVKLKILFKKLHLHEFLISHVYSPFVYIVLPYLLFVLIFSAFTRTLCLLKKVQYPFVEKFPSSEALRSGEV